MKKLVVGNFYLGKDYSIDSWTTYKRAILTGQLCVVVFCASIFFFLFDTYFGAKAGLINYAILFSGSIASLFLIRKHHYSWAKIVIMAAGNTAVFFAVSMDKYDSGAHLFFICCILAAFTLFGYEEKLKGFSFSVLSVVLFLMAYNVEISFLPTPDFPQENLDYNFYINFILTAAISVFIIVFLLKINFESEAILLKNEEKLTTLNTDLKVSQSRFQLAIQGSSAGIWDWDAIEDKLYISPILAKMLGYDPEQFPETNREKLVDAVHPEDREHFEVALDSHLKNRSPFKLECRLRKQDGDYLWAYDSGQAEWDSNGNPLRMVGSIINITEGKNTVKKMEEQNRMLEKTNEELDRFVYSTTHDLKAPLSSILGLIRVMEMTNDKEEHEKCMEMMKQRVSTLNGFIKDIINYARNTRLDLTEDHVQLTEMMENIISNLEYFEQRKAIRIELDFDKELNFHCDKDRLKIIMNNLVANAIKYHNIEQPDPYIIVHASIENDLMTLSVEDNGLGIEKTAQSKIFDMFFRASETSEGSGLGLYIAREMTDKLNGEISVKSVLQKGSVFSLRIPLA